MTESAEKFDVSSDRPIEALKADLLGRGRFAISLANGICAWNGAESLVLAVYGEWGTGKTSVKNIVTSLVGQRENSPTVVEFNPWEWSGGNRLLEIFFEEIGTALSKGAKEADPEELSKKWRRYAARLTLGSTALGYLKTATELAGIPVLPFALGALSSAAKSSASVAEQAASAHATDVEDTSLAEMKLDLRNALKELPSPMLVVIDDVDRLHRDEIRTLFRLVKINADFPNLIYLMLFDRRIIESALADATADTGRNYMEKIVQAGFDLPQVPHSVLENVLSKALHQLLDRQAYRRTFDEERWQGLYLDGIRHYCSSLRNIKRFISSLSFEIGLFLYDDTLEVNVIDLIGIEALRVFEPQLHRALRESSLSVLGRERYFISEADTSEGRRNLAERLLSHARGESREAALGILRALFPQFEALLRGHSSGSGQSNVWLRDLRVCHESMFGRYFQMSLAEGDVPQSLVDSVIDLSGDRERLRELFQSVIANGKFAELLYRLESCTTILKLENAESFATALLDVGDGTPQEHRPSSFIPLDSYATRVIHFYLMRDQDRSRRSNVLIRSLEATHGSWFPVQLVRMEEPKEESAGFDLVIFDESGLQRAQSICVEKIRRLAESGRLIAPGLSEYLLCWQRWGSAEEVQAWTESVTAGPIEVLRVLRALLQSVYVPGTEHQGILLNLDLLAQFVDVNRIGELISPLLEEPIAEEFEQVKAEFDSTILAARRAFKLPTTDDAGAHHSAASPE